MSLIIVKMMTANDRYEGLAVRNTVTGYIAPVYGPISLRSAVTSLCNNPTEDIIRKLENEAKEMDNCYTGYHG